MWTGADEAQMTKSLRWQHWWQTEHSHWRDGNISNSLAPSTRRSGWLSQFFRQYGVRSEQNLSGREGTRVRPKSTIAVGIFNRLHLLRQVPILGKRRSKALSCNISVIDRCPRERVVQLIEVLARHDWIAHADPVVRSQYKKIYNPCTRTMLRFCPHNRHLSNDYASRKWWCKMVIEIWVQGIRNNHTFKIHCGKRFGKSLTITPVHRRQLSAIGFSDQGSCDSRTIFLAVHHWPDEL